MTVLPVAEFCPDQPDLSEYTNIASGVIALTPQSYGPIKAPVAFSTNRINTQCLGMGLGHASGVIDEHHIFAGTTASLFHIPQGSTTWTNVRKAGGYTTAAGEYWRFSQFKDLELATNFTDPIQSYDMAAGGLFADLSADAPNARYIATAKNFAIVANTWDAVGGYGPARVWWSANGAPGTWPTPGSALAQQDQSDFNDLVGTQGEITGLAANLAGCDCAVFMEHGVYRMIYSGPPEIFDFYPALTAKGCLAPNSVVPFGAYVYYYGEDGFYVFDGNVAIPIGDTKVDKWFFNNVDQSALDLVIGAPDVTNKAICWIFKSINTTQTWPDTMLVYRWDIQRWSMASLNLQWISRTHVTDTDSGTPPSTSGLAIGQLQLGAINSRQYLAFFNGSNVAALIGTKAIQITPNMRSFVSATRPLVDSAPQQGFLLTESGLIITTEAGVSLLTEADAATITVALSARNTYQDAEIFGPERTIDVSGQCSDRSEGRIHRGRISIPAGLWTTCAGLDVTKAIRASQR